MTPDERIETILEHTKPLRHPRGGRLPLYVWGAMDPPGNEAQLEAMLKALDERGIAACSTWRSAEGARTSLERALLVASVQKRLGLRVNVNATPCTYAVCDGSPETAHLDAQGKPFFDTTTSPHVKLGCPFRLRVRYPAMRARIEPFLDAYKRHGLEVAFIFADWEIDGPIEWQGGWDAAKRCVVCCKNIPEIENFLAFQRAYRKIRSEVQRECFARPVLARVPKALVGNYGVYPHGGWRYWYDYFEKEPGPGVPVRMDFRCPVRPWAEEFGDCGYTFAMPTVYTWYRTWFWYDWSNGDYRWFYNMLQVASNAAAHTPPDVPLITFVHHTTTSPPRDPDPRVEQMSGWAYKELLWHMLLRGHDTFFVWCPDQELAHEVALVHEVWAAALEHREFLEGGKPVNFEVPRRPGPVVSALRLGERLLVRRTDFDRTAEPVELRVGERVVRVPRVEGRCQVLELPR